jgi:predicted dehydrogenase
MRLFVVGCGSIGRRHLSNLIRLGECDILAYDASTERRAEVADQFGIDAVPSLEAGFDERPDCVLICTPNRLHTAHALAAVHAGAHVFIEKPMADSLEGVETLIAEAAARERRILVGCNFRFDRGLKRVKRLVDDGVLGRVLGARIVFGQYLPDWHPWEDYRRGYSARSDLGGGIILDAIHELDYARWILGEAEAVFCMAGTTGSLEIDVEDTADILLRLSDGVSVSIHVDYLQRAYKRELELYGSEGTLQWSFQEKMVRWFTASNKHWHSESWTQDPSFTVDEMYLAEMSHFLDCAAGRSTPELDGVGGRRVLEIALAAKQSARSNALIELG